MSSGDLALLETVMATPEELAAAGVPKDIVAKVAAAAPKRAELVAELRKKLVGWTKQTVWNRFDGTFPHVIPADPASGLEKDLILYENAMVIPGTTAAQQNPAKLAFLQIPDMIQLGATWKFIELPRAIDPGEADRHGGQRHPRPALRSSQQRRAARRGGRRRLESPCRLRHQECAVAPDGRTEKIAQYQRRPRAALARRGQGVEESRRATELQQASRRQPGRSLAHRALSARQEDCSTTIIADGGKLGSYAAYCMIDAEFAMNNNAPGANILANQKKWMADLEEFLKSSPNSDEVPPVLLHLANANEFNAEEKKAREQYGKLVEGLCRDRRRQESGRRPRRLDLAGQPLVIKGTGCKMRRSTRRSFWQAGADRLLGELGVAGQGWTCPS